MEGTAQFRRGEIRRGFVLPFSNVPPPGSRPVSNPVGTPFYLPMLPARVGRYQPASLWGKATPVARSMSMEIYSIPLCADIQRMLNSHVHSIVRASGMIQMTCVPATRDKKEFGGNDDNATAVDVINRSLRVDPVDDVDRARRRFGAQSAGWFRGWGADRPDVLPAVHGHR